MKCYDLAHYAVLAFGSLFVIVDPIPTGPAFLAMTPQDIPAQRSARRGGHRCPDTPAACSAESGLLTSNRGRFAFS
jgi:hypothetical protein